MNRKVIGAVAAMLLAGVSGGAAAHPHIWVDVVTTVRAAEGKVTALEVQWTLDPFYSADLLQEFDRNGDGKITGAESAAMEKNAFAFTRRQDYFMRIAVDGKQLKGLFHSGFAASTVGDRIRYRFVLGLPRPVDPVAATLTVTMYEQDYYVFVGPDEEQPVAMTGDQSLSCTGEVGEEKSITLYFGFFHPQKLTLRCRGAAAG